MEVTIPALKADQHHQSSDNCFWKLQKQPSTNTTYLFKIGETIGDVGEFRQLEQSYVLQHVLVIFSFCLSLCAFKLHVVSLPVQHGCTSLSGSFCYSTKWLLFTRPLALWLGHCPCDHHYNQVPHSRSQQELLHSSVLSCVCLFVCSRPVPV